MDDAFDKIRKTVLRELTLPELSSPPASVPLSVLPLHVYIRRFGDALSRAHRATHPEIANWTKRDATAIHRPRLSSPVSRSLLSSLSLRVVNLSSGNSLESGGRRYLR